MRTNTADGYFVANLDTYGGNSGSPVFNSDTHEVEGILVRGERDFVQAGGCTVSLVCPDTGCRGEDCTRVTRFASHVPIDEPTEGLAPKIVEVIADVIRDIHRQGVSVVLVEQKLTIALKVSTRVSVMGHGRIVFEGPPAQLHERQDVVQEWLAV